MAGPAPDPTAALTERYPRLAAYLAGLPEGLASFPTCLARTSVARAQLESAGVDPVAAPRLVQELFDPPAHGWMPEVGLQATTLAIADQQQMTDQALLAWNHSVNLEIFRSPIYRALMALLSPRRLLERGATRWEAFHRGTVLTLVPTAGDHAAEAVLTFPPRVFTPLLLQLYAGAFRAALAHSRADDVTVDVAAWSDTSAHFMARWR